MPGKGFGVEGGVNGGGNCRSRIVEGSIDKWNRRKIPKAKPDYQERKRRIEKKFGARGEKGWRWLGCVESVGGSEQEEVWCGCTKGGGSRRGRELRAAAALKRREA